MRPRRAGHGSRRLGPRRPRRLRERRPFGPRRGRTARITTGPGRRIRVRRSAAVDCATRPDAQPLPFHPSHTPPCPLIACLPACLPACLQVPARHGRAVGPACATIPGAGRRKAGRAGHSLGNLRAERHTLVAPGRVAPSHVAPSHVCWSDSLLSIPEGASSREGSRRLPVTRRRRSLAAGCCLLPCRPRAVYSLAAWPGAVAHTRCGRPSPRTLREVVCTMLREVVCDTLSRGAVCALGRVFLGCVRLVASRREVPFALLAAYRIVFLQGLVACALSRGAVCALGRP